MSKIYEDAVLAEFHSWLRNNYRWTSKLAYHIPNELNRGSLFQKSREKSKGLLTGAVDYCIDIPNKFYHGLRLEFKDKYKSKTSSEQIKHHERLQICGYKVEIVRDLDEAIKIWHEYVIHVDEIMISQLNSLRNQYPKKDG
jgi:hypothetical protein